MDFRPRSRPADRGLRGLKRGLPWFYFTVWTYGRINALASEKDVGLEPQPLSGQRDNYTTTPISGYITMPPPRIAHENNENTKMNNCKDPPKSGSMFGLKLEDKIRPRSKDKQFKKQSIVCAYMVGTTSTYA